MTFHTSFQPPSRIVPVIGNPLANLIQPTLKVIVNLGYGDPNYGFSTSYADVQTPFGLWPDVPPQVIADALIAGANQGVNHFASDLQALATQPLLLPSPQVPQPADVAAALSAAPRGEQWTGEEVALLSSLSIRELGPAPADPTNRVTDDPRAVEFGRKLFFDTRLSANGQVSCATCHMPEREFQDGTPLAKGVGVTNRRTMPIAGMAHSPFLFWDGRKDSLWAQALGPLESPVEHGGSREQYAQVIAAHYQPDYDAVFGARDYAMQVWLDPTRLQSLNLTAQDVTAALRGQNVQVGSGVLNQPPLEKQLAFQVAVRTLGRLSDPDEFANIVVKRTGEAVVRIVGADHRAREADKEIERGASRQFDPAVVAAFAPAATMACAMSWVPTEPNNLPSAPALAAITTSRPFKRSARACAVARISVWARSSSARCASNFATFAAVAGTALRLGMR